MNKAKVMTAAIACIASAIITYPFYVSIFHYGIQTGQVIVGGVIGTVATFLFLAAVIVAMMMKPEE